MGAVECYRSNFFPRYICSSVKPVFLYTEEAHFDPL